MSVLHGLYGPPVRIHGTVLIDEQKVSSKGGALWGERVAQSLWSEHRRKAERAEFLLETLE
jgi:hypothetical protein